MKAVLISIAALAFTGSLPALYAGAMIVKATNNFLWFTVPSLACIAVGCACIALFERN